MNSSPYTLTPTLSLKGEGGLGQPPGMAVREGDGLRDSAAAELHEPHGLFKLGWQYSMKNERIQILFKSGGFGSVA